MISVQSLSERHIRMLSRNVRKILRLKDSKIITEPFPSVLRVNDVVNETSLGTNQRIGKALRVLDGMLLCILASINNLNRAFGSHDCDFCSSPCATRDPGCESATNLQRAISRGSHALQATLSPNMDELAFPEPHMDPVSFSRPSHAPADPTNPTRDPGCESAANLLIDITTQMLA
jgi:hypothetical protein